MLQITDVVWWITVLDSMENKVPDQIASHCIEKIWEVNLIV